MKKVIKFTFVFAFVVIAGIAGFWAYINYFTEESDKKSLSMVPDDAVFIIETNNLSNAWTEISNSKVWTFLKKDSYFNDLNSDIEDLNKYLKENKFAELILKDRNLTMSIHMISAKEWDFMFVVDLKKTANVLKGNLKETLGLVDGYVVFQREYKGSEIIELADSENPKDIIYLTLSDNLLVAAFSGALIEKAIDQKADNHWQNNLQFNKVLEKIAGNNLFKMYANYSQLNKFSMSYLTEESETLKMFANSLRYTAFNINLKNELLSFRGYTDIDSMGSYIKALSKVRPAKYTSWEILSNQTSLYFAMSFENYNEFYQNLIYQYKEGNAEDMEDIEKNVKQIENYLDISMENDFFSWIGNEISFAKLRPGEKTRIEDVLVLFKAKDINMAKVGLSNILKKIKNRTPLKFEKETYKNYDIQCLERRGFFKLFFGKLFNNMEKPYFTFIDDYVVFSNSIETLKSEIDDYITGNTLSHDSNFENFKDEFSNKANITLIMITPKIYENLYYYSNPTDRADIKENRDFILSFSQIGFQLVSEGDIFETFFIAKHNPEAVTADKLEVFEKETSDALFSNEIDSLYFKHSFAENTFPTDTFYKELYISSDKIKYEGRILQNLPEGVWKDYYESGNIKSSVNYINGEINGEAFFFYDREPKVTRAEMTFEQDEIVGIYFEYYENGAQKAKINYKKGKADGDAEFYHKNGRIKIKAKFDDGLKDGKWDYFDKKGEKIGTEKWRNGIKKR